MRHTMHAMQVCKIMKFLVYLCQPKRKNSLLEDKTKTYWWFWQIETQQSLIHVQKEVDAIKCFWESCDAFRSAGKNVPVTARNSSDFKLFLNRFPLSQNWHHCLLFLWIYISVNWHHVFEEHHVIITLFHFDDEMSGSFSSNVLFQALLW